MIPTDQTILHDPANGVHGNCFSAVLASLLHLPVESVPVFVGRFWQAEVNAWLRPMGLAYVEISTNPDWCAANDIRGMHHELAGVSPRNAEVLHATVAVDGEMVHDPHPDRSGLGEGERTFGLLIALRPWEAKASAA